MHTDISTHYLGLELRSPLVVGACPITLKPETVRELTIAGAGAVVLPSLLEEQIVRLQLERGDEPSAREQRVEACGAAQREDGYNGGVDAYLRSISLLKHHTGIPIIANLNGCTEGNWLEFASELEDRGADAIELSLQTNNCDPGVGAEAVESMLLGAVSSVCDLVSIPVSVKLLPFFTSLPNLAWRLTEAGAAGIVLFGREPIWEIRDGDLISTSMWSLSGSAQLQTTLSGLIRVRQGGPAISVAASGGIATPKDVIHTVIAGADVAMVTSEIYRTGPDAIAHILDGVIHYMERKGIDSFEEFTGKREKVGVGDARQQLVRPMLQQEPYRDPRPEPAQQTGDRWGHSLPSPLDD